MSNLKLKAAGLALAFALSGTAAVAETTLRLSFNQPESSPAWSQAMGPYADRLEALSAGRIQVERYPGEVLHPVADGFRAAATGITDVTSAWPLYQASSFALFHGLGLPGALPDSDIAAIPVMDELYARYLRGEYERMGVVLAFNAATPSYDILSTRPINSLDDLRGLRIRAGGSTSTQIIKRLGAVPVTMPITDTYTAFQQGVVDGVHLASADLVAYRLTEIGKHLYQVGLGRIPAPHAINASFYGQLSGDLQAIFAEAGHQGGYDYARMYTELTETAFERMEADDVTVVQVNPEDQARINELLEPMWAEFIAQNGGEDSDAAQFVTDMRELTARYGAMSDEEILALPPLEGLR